MGVKLSGNWDQGLPDTSGLEDCVRAALDDALTYGAEQGQRYISIRGIKKPGRIETGDMLQSFVAAIVNTRGGAAGSIGWLDEEPDYSLYQEYGTRYIEEMRALRDAAEDTKDRLKENLDNCAGNWWK